MVNVGMRDLRLWSKFSRAYGIFNVYLHLIDSEWMNHHRALSYAMSVYLNRQNSAFERIHDGCRDFGSFLPGVREPSIYSNPSLSSVGPCLGIAVNDEVNNVAVTNGYISSVAQLFSKIRNKKLLRTQRRSKHFRQSWWPARATRQ